MLIADTSVLVDFFAGRDTPQVDQLANAARRLDLGTGDLMICEVPQGLRDEAELSRVRHALLALTVFSISGVHLALAAAENYRTLRRRGVTVRGTIDCLIATFCIERGHVLLHNDRDFDHFEEHLGLRVLR